MRVKKFLAAVLCGIIFTGVLASCSFADLEDEPNVEELLNAAYAPEVWRSHVTDNLMKYWDKPEITDMKGGLFPTYITNDGHVLPENLNLEELPEEFKLAEPSLVQLDKNFVRMHSRLTYAFGVAFHMTGNKHYLEICRRGVLGLLDAFDEFGGIHITKNIKTGEWDKDFELRTAQDLAYGLNGLGMYYFLTRDRTVLYKILQIKDFIFDFYFDKSKDYLTWKPKYINDPEIHLVAQLDQLYSYMLLLAPVLPEPYSSEWKQDINNLVNIMLTRFYSEKYGFLWGTDNNIKTAQLGTQHSDFGHSVKALWVILKAGEILNNQFYISFAKDKINELLELAYLPESGSWARCLNKDNKLDKDKEWWIYAELDQACEILALEDPTYYEILNKTHKYWFDKMIDKEHGEAWHFIKADDDKPALNLPKAHNWKNAMHSFEHALFGYMTSSHAKAQPFSVYFAFSDMERKINDVVTVSGKLVPYEFSDYLRRYMQPYMFSAEIQEISVESQAEFMPDKNIIYKASFIDLR